MSTGKKTKSASSIGGNEVVQKPIPRWQDGGPHAFAYHHTSKKKQLTCYAADGHHASKQKKQLICYAADGYMIGC